jgi:hypothetical protein
MGKKHYSLGITENNQIINIIRIVFGFVCLVIAIFWLVFNITSIKSDITLWITIIFLSGFGLYQILSGFGRTTVFIEFGPDIIKLKKNPILPLVEIRAADIEKIEIFPLNVVFFLKTKKRILLRFGTTYNDINIIVKDELADFAESNKIPLEVMQEKL